MFTLNAYELVDVLGLSVNYLVKITLHAMR